MAEGGKFAEKCVLGEIISLKRLFPTWIEGSLQKWENFWICKKYKIWWEKDWKKTLSSF